MSSTHQTHTPHESKEDTEFSFWGSAPNNTISCEKNDSDQLGGNETRLLLQRALVSNSDPSSRSKAIEEGRKELMEMMQDMPESSYELSFQDMVVEQQQQQQEVPQPQPDSRSEAQQLQHKKLKKKKKKEKKNKSNNRPGQILRVESMDSETFLLKMFFPTSLDWMKKPKVQNCSKVSPKQVDKEWKIKRFFTEQNTGSSSSSSSNDKSRNVDRSFSFSHSCCPFFHYIKSKTKKLGG